MIEPAMDHEQWYGRLKDHSIGEAGSIVVSPSLTMDRLEDVAESSEEGTQAIHDMAAVLHACCERLQELGDVADVPFAVAQVEGEEIAIPLWLLILYAAEQASVTADCADAVREAEARLMPNM